MKVPVLANVLKNVLTSASADPGRGERRQQDPGSGWDLRGRVDAPGQAEPHRQRRAHRQRGRVRRPSIRRAPTSSTTPWAEAGGVKIAVANLIGNDANISGASFPGIPCVNLKASQ